MLCDAPATIYARIQYDDTFSSFINIIIIILYLYTIATTWFSGFFYIEIFCFVFGGYFFYCYDMMGVHTGVK